MVNCPLLTSIGDYVFYSCSGLTTVDFPLVTSIGDYAFASCNALETVNLPVATHIGEGAFSSGTTVSNNLREVSLPAATFIGRSAFADCTALETVNLPEATSIDTYVFSYCTALQELNIPAVESIGTYTFSQMGTQSLTITMGATAPTLGARLVSNSGSSSTKKSFTVKVPYVQPDGNDWAGGYDRSWGDAFLGQGTDHTTTVINYNVNLIIMSSL
jgi:hypothetical protein